MSDCGGGKPLMPLEQAVEFLLERALPPPDRETVALDQAGGRILALPVSSTVDVPAWDNSAMDGYALRAADLPQGGGMLPLAGRATAGSAPASLSPGHAARIFTGAPLPAGADTVVAQEDCEATAESVCLPAVLRGSHVRRRGEEMREGDPLLPAGQHLRAQDIGLLASQGIASVPVYRRLRVALLSSGNELREPGETLSRGQIFNANLYTLAAVLQGWGCEVVRCPAMPDDFSATCTQMLAASRTADVVISSGGVSVGDGDHLKAAVSSLGRLDLWRIAIQPGKPLAFGDVAGKPWLGLPGNPVAALVTILMVARPWLLRSQGREPCQLQAQNVAAGFAWPAAKPRRQFLRARLADTPTGQEAVLHAHQGSAMLGAASWADGLVEVKENRILQPGETVRYWPFAQLLN